MSQPERASANTYNRQKLELDNVVILESKFGFAYIQSGEEVGEKCR